MIDTQRLGALLRALVRDDAQTARLRTPAAIAVRPTDGVDPELDSPGAQVAHVAAPVGAIRLEVASVVADVLELGRGTGRIALTDVLA